MLSKQDFWAIINKAVEQSYGDIEKQETIMVELLSHYDDISIASFRYIADELAYAIESWDLLSAEMILQDDSLLWSEDSHYYFLLWIVSLGANAYYSILKNPDSIVDFLPKCDNLEEIDPTYEMYLVSYTAFYLKYKDIEDNELITQYIENAAMEAEKQIGIERNFTIKGKRFINIEELRLKLPRLCKLYESEKSLENLFEIYFREKE